MGSGTMIMSGGNYCACVLVDSKNILLFFSVPLMQSFLFFFILSLIEIFLLIIRHLNISILLLEVMDD